MTEILNKNKNAKLKWLNSPRNGAKNLIDF